MHPIEHLCCQNPDCPERGRRGQGNLTFRGGSGKGKRIRMVSCRSCKARFSERKGTVLEQARLPEGKVLDVLNHLREGCGTRGTGRLVGVDKNTVTRYVLLAGAHADTLHQDWWPFPPRTHEAQVDEKGGFVFQKEQSCDPDDPRDRLCGDDWDHTALDPENRLRLALGPGKRDAVQCQRLIQHVPDRTAGRRDLLITSDAPAPSATAITAVSGVEQPQPRRPGPGRPPKPPRVLPPELGSATVCKKRKKGRVVEVVRMLIFGMVSLLGAYLERSRVSTTINTSFVERNNGTDRHQNARKHRKTCGFSKDLEVHPAASYFVGYCYNFCWSVRTLRVHGEDGHWQQRTPAMAAGLTDHIWSLWEWITYPARPR
jgi:transposase-like protein